MRLLFLALSLILLSASPTWAVQAFVEAASTAGNTVTSINVVFSTTSVTNGMVVCGMRVNDGTLRTLTVTDNKSSSYTNGPTQAEGSGDILYSAYAFNVTSSTGPGVTVTLALSGSAVFVEPSCSLYSGFPSGSSLDQSTSSQGSGTAFASGSVTTTCANETIVGIGDILSGTVGFTATSPFTRRTDNVSNAVPIEDDIVTATGSYNPQGTWTATGTAWGGITLAFADIASPCSAPSGSRRRGHGLI